MGLFNKKELVRIEKLENELSMLKVAQDKLGITNFLDAEKKIKEAETISNFKMEKELANHIELIKNLEEKSLLLNLEHDLSANKINDLSIEIKQKQSEIYDIDEQLLNESFGIYTPKYECVNSAEYADKISIVREKQKKAIKMKDALSFFDQWTLDGSKTKGQAMNNDNMKMVLRAFNNECDVLINKAKFNNIDKIRDQIKKSASAIDKLSTRNKISINQSYINLKIEELELVYEYQCKKQDEKDAIRQARAEEREQVKLQKEIEDAKKVINKELAHYTNAKEKLIVQLESSNAEDKILLNKKIEEMDKKLEEIDKSLKEIDYREANQRAGYVYIISNIGAFGKNIYKIGMTRRLEPQDRIDELGDASVPFTFDVHAMIFSDDAPKLESALHAAFEKNKVNMINGRKEFFNVSLDEIEKIIRKNHDKLVEIKKEPDAEQYRETQIIKGSSILQ